MPDPTLYLFDGFNVLRATDLEDVPALVDRLASFVALHGARGVVVFDGVGEDKAYGPLEVRYAQHADALLERLAAEHRASETVCLVSSDSAVRGTSGQEVQKRSSRTFLGDLHEPGHVEAKRSQLRDRVDEETRKRLEKLRRGQGTG
jgi:predicted RNA-binding protein with PIN domain